MPTFEFRYQTLLNHRRRIEDERQRDLAMHMRSRMIFMEQLEQIQQTIRRSKHDMAGSLVGRVNLSEVGRFAGYSRQAENRGRQIVYKLAQAEKDIQQAREKLLDATHRRKALELLRDKHERRWRREQERAERAALDEMSTQQFIRAMIEPEVRR